MNSRRQLFYKKLMKRMIFFAILIAAYLLYTWKMTFSDIWYDEAVEYWYSKILTGKTPGGYDYTNIYERVLSTYQPPLYNILMHVWLAFFDIDIFSFRLAGVITTLIGAAGLYLAIEAVSDWRFASFGMGALLLTNSIAFYAMECAEYNLMVCMLSWALFFYARLLKKRDMFSVTGFFITCTFAVYSQYGAAFAVAGLYVSMFLFICKEDRVWIKNYMIATVIELMAAVVPLIVFFLSKQIVRQGTMTVSHMPSFEENIIADIVYALYKQAGWCLSASFENSTGRWGMLFAGMEMLLTAIAVFTHNKTLRYIAYGLLVAWTGYYLAVVTSYYAYNDWSGNTRFGNKYGLFLTPLLVFFLTCGVYVFYCRYIRTKSAVQIKIIFATVMILLICKYGQLEYQRIKINWVKEDFAKGMNVYLADEGYKIPTYVHSHSDYVFKFYYVHAEEELDGYDENIITVGPWIDEKEIFISDAEKNLNDLGMFKNTEFYYVGCNNDSVQLIRTVIAKNGYTQEVMYKGFGTGYFIRCTKGR